MAVNCSDIPIAITESGEVTLMEERASTLRVAGLDVTPENEA